MADTVTLQLDDETSATVHPHGATLISWKDCGRELIFCSKKAVFDNKKAIRGGIPLVFPNFGPWSLGPQHGFARIKPWKLTSKPQMTVDGHVVAAFRLEDDEETRAMWDAKFNLVYTVTLGKHSLTTSLNVSNTGTTAFDFTTLMHTYFHVPDITKTTVSGLKGCVYTDKVHGGDHTETRDLVQVDENYDRIYQNVAGPVQVVPDSRDEVTSLAITTSSLPDIVVWNPWIEKAKDMADFGDDEYVNMLCVEAGHVSERCNLDPGSTQQFFQTIHYNHGQAKM